MKLRVQLSQEEMCEAVQDYIAIRIKPLDYGEENPRFPRVKYVARVDGNKNLFHMDVAYEDPES